MKSADHSSYSIALVDDEPRIHETVAQILSDAGLMAKRHSFEEPVGFLEFLKSGRDVPDLVLLDVHFENAGLSGVDILPFIREEHPTLPVILLTGMDADAMQEAEEDEFTYYIPKPVSPDQLVRMVKFYMRKSQKTGGAGGASPVRDQGFPGIPAVAGGGHWPIASRRSPRRPKPEGRKAPPSPSTRSGRYFPPCWCKARSCPP